MNVIDAIDVLAKGIEIEKSLRVACEYWKARDEEAVYVDLKRIHDHAIMTVISLASQVLEAT